MRPSLGRNGPVRFVVPSISLPPFLPPVCLSVRTRIFFQFFLLNLLRVGGRCRPFTPGLLGARTFSHHHSAVVFSRTVTSMQPVPFTAGWCSVCSPGTACCPGGRYRAGSGAGLCLRRCSAHARWRHTVCAPVGRAPRACWGPGLVCAEPMPPETPLKWWQPTLSPAASLHAALASALQKMWA